MTTPPPPPRNRLDVLADMVQQQNEAGQVQLRPLRPLITELETLAFQAGALFADPSLPLDDLPPYP